MTRAETVTVKRTIGLAAFVLFTLALASVVSAQTEQATQSRDYVLGVGDELTVTLWKNPELESTVFVRPDGRLSLPLVGEVEAAGLAPAELQQVVQARYGEFIGVPTVTVLVRQINSRKIFIVGEVANPGAYDLLRPLTIMQALALAGWVSDFAKMDELFVLREGTNRRIEVNLKSIMSGKDAAGNISLELNDTIVVP